jgi:hypothetical protein
MELWADERSRLRIRLPSSPSSAKKHRLNECVVPLQKSPHSCRNLFRDTRYIETMSINAPPILFRAFWSRRQQEIDNIDRHFRALDCWPTPLFYAGGVCKAVYDKIQTSRQAWEAVKSSADALNLSCTLSHGAENVLAWARTAWLSRLHAFHKELCSHPECRRDSAPTCNQEGQQGSQGYEEDLDILVDGLGLALKCCEEDEVVRSKLAREDVLVHATQLREQLPRHIRRVFHPDDPDDEEMADTIICPSSASVAGSRPSSPVRSRASSPGAWSVTTEGTELL